MERSPALELLELLEVPRLEALLPHELELVPAMLFVLLFVLMPVFALALVQLQLRLSAHRWLPL